MKRLTAFFVLFLTALCFALTASAAGDAIHSVTINGNAVKVSVTAQSDCHLFAALYDESGQLLDVQSADLFASAKQRITTFLFSDGIPEKAYAKAFLMDRNAHTPLCKSFSTRAEDTPTPTPAPDSDVYAILYADGTMVFQHGDTPESGREVSKIYTVDMTEHYHYDEDTHTSTVPWRNTSQIQRVEFSDKISPNFTAYWFYNCRNLTEIKNLENLDTSNVTDMSHMFGFCNSLTALDVSGFNTANVTDMSYMFYYCNLLTALDVSGFNTANVTDMSYMFFRCSLLTALDMSGFNTAKVTNMKDMFADCQALTTIYASENFLTNQAVDSSDMFYYCFSLVGGNGAKYDANHTDAAYACIDGPDNPGYFTAK